MKDSISVTAEGWQVPKSASCRWGVALVTSTALLVSGCATSPGEARGPLPSIVAESLNWFGEQLGSAKAKPEEVTSNTFLELPEDIREYLDREVASLDTEEDRYRALRTWALEEFSPEFEYDPSHTAPIEELADSGRINCFSFSNMFVAAARYTDIPAQFQLVDSPPQWDFKEETWVVSQHINVSGLVYREMTEREKELFISQQKQTGTRIFRSPPRRVRRTYVVDLNPEIAEDAYRSRTISDGAARALFHSNRSVEAMMAGNIEEAMTHGRAAIAADERSPTAWNNFGVLLARQDKLEDAKQAYRTALALDPDGEIGASNLERIYRRTGDTEKAEAMTKRIYRNRMKNPYYHYAMGERSVEDGDLESAVEHFKEAIRRKFKERLFHYALAETHIKLGDYESAAKDLARAAENSTSRDLERYQAVSHQLLRVQGEG
ncbi:MAG: tetratricopeptide repeat protein [Pseudomonadota bacterium]